MSPPRHQTTTVLLLITRTQMTCCQTQSLFRLFLHNFSKHWTCSQFRSFLLNFWPPFLVPVTDSLRSSLKWWYISEFSISPFSLFILHMSGWPHLFPWLQLLFIADNFQIHISIHDTHHEIQRHDTCMCCMLSKQDLDNAAIPSLLCEWHCPSPNFHNTVNAASQNIVPLYL